MNQADDYSGTLEALERDPIAGLYLRQGLDIEAEVLGQTDDPAVLQTAQARAGELVAFARLVFQPAPALVQRWFPEAVAP